MNVLLVAVALASVWYTGCGKGSLGTSTMIVLTNGVMTVDTREKLAAQRGCNLTLDN